MGKHSFVKGKPTASAWKIIKAIPHHGIALPLFSLKTKKSSGVGEFYDLLLVIDYCKSIGFSVIQLLPLNDTQKECSPYSAVSSCALHPLYLSLHALPYVKTNQELQEELKALKHFNTFSHLQYEELRKAKSLFLLGYFHKYFKRFENKSSYKTFLKNNPWLKEYALFLVLKEKFDDLPWQSWPKAYRDITATTVDSLSDLYHTQVSFHYFLQYLCYLQLKKVSQYAKKKNVHLMGDIPIFLSKESADVWRHKSDFDLDHLAGAPPDQLNQEGQKWGFPLYNWEAMAKSGYRLWKSRLKYASHFYSIYRIDHIVGFFRVFAIEKSKAAVQGRFIPEDSEIWEKCGREHLLVFIRTTSMLPIGEDLGDIPPMVKPCLEALGICGTKVMRWEKHWQGDKSFIDPFIYSPLSLTTLSTHDSTTLTQWWQKSPEEAMAFAKAFNLPYQKTLSASLRKKILSLSHKSSSLFHINLLFEYLRLIPSFSAKKAEEEQINRPGEISPKNWGYRIPVDFEKIAKHKSLKKFLKSLT